jgi:hypothetical protein
LKDRINELETSNKNKNIKDLYRGINEFKKGCQPRIILKYGNGNLLTDLHSVLNRWKVFFNRLLNVHGVYTAEPLVPGPRLVEVEIAIEELRSYKSPGTDQIPSELIKAGSETLYSEMHRLICYIWDKEELPQHWKESIIVPVHRKRGETDCTNYRGISVLSVA